MLGDCPQRASFEKSSAASDQLYAAVACGLERSVPGITDQTYSSMRLEDEGHAYGRVSLLISTPQSEPGLL